MATVSQDHPVDRDLRVLTSPKAALLVCVIVAVGVFEALWFGVVTGSGMAALDPEILAWTFAHRDVNGLLTVARVVTDAGSPAVSITGLVVAIGWWAWTRDRRRVLLGLGGLAGILVVDVAMKAVVARPRPPLPFHVVAAQGYSFPSGHAMFSAGAVLLVLWLLRDRVTALGSPMLRASVASVTVLLVVAIGLSRIVLGVYDPSGVLAGWALAVLVVAGVALLDVATIGRRS